MFRLLSYFLSKLKTGCSRIGWWVCPPGWGRNFTSGLTVIGLHFQVTWNNLHIFGTQGQENDKYGLLR